MLPDGGGVNILKVVQFFLGKKPVLLHQTGKMALHLDPGQVGGRALHRNRERREAVSILIFQPLRRAPVTGMIGHVLLYLPLAGKIAVPLLEGGVNIGLGDFPERRWCCFHLYLLWMRLPVLFHFLRGQVTTFSNKLAQPLFHIKPGNSDFFCFLVSAGLSYDNANIRVIIGNT